MKDSTKLKLSLLFKGKKRDPSIGAKISQSLKGRYPSAETRKRMSVAAKRTLNGFKKGHPVFDIRDKEAFRNKMRIIATQGGYRPTKPAGYKITEETREKMRLSARTRNARYWKGKDRSALFTVEYRHKMSQIMKRIVLEGKHNFYIDGRTPLHRKLRRSMEYKLWREEVFKRDDWTCQVCKSRGERLHAHHIKSFSKFPDLRFVVSNGVTLCEPCHRQTDNYGRKALSPIQSDSSLAGMVK